MQWSHRPSLLEALPLLLVVCYMAVSFALYLWGPVAWTLLNTSQLTAFLVLSMLGLSLGYVLGMFVDRKGGGREIAGWRMLLRVGALASVVLLIPSTLALADKMPWDAWQALFCQDKAYKSTLLVDQSSHKIWRQVFAFSGAVCAPAMYAVLPLAIMYASRLKFIDWILVSIHLVCLVTISIVTGTDKESGDIAIVFVSMSLLFIYRGLTLKNISGLTVLLMVASTVLVCMAGAAMFQYRKQSRMEGSCSIYCNCTPAQLPVSHSAALQSQAGSPERSDEHSNLTPTSPSSPPSALPLPPDSFDASRTYGPYYLAMASAYLSQGFYGLSLAFDEPFDSTYGLGHSPLVISLLGRRLLPNIDARTYTHKISLRGWDDRGHWATALLWIANDVGFDGVPVVLAIFAFVFALCWRDAALGSTSATILLMQLMVFVFFMPANNQLLLTLDSYASFVLWFAVWGFGRIREHLNKADVHLA